MCRNRKQSSSQSPQQLTAGQMGGCQSPLWHSSSCPLPPATAPTASRSPVRSFKVLAKLLTEQSLKDECPRLLGRSKIAQTLFSPRQHLEFTHLKNSHVQLMSFPRPFGGANCSLIIIRSSMKALKGAWSGGLMAFHLVTWFTYWWKGFLWKILCTHCDFIQLWFLHFRLLKLSWLIFKFTWHNVNTYEWVQLKCND